MKYSLADYVLSIQPNDSTLRRMFGNIVIGGDGENNAYDQIDIALNDNLWDTTSFATGAWIHNKNLSRVGTVSINLSMLSTYTNTLTQLCKQYYSMNNYAGVTIVVSDRVGNQVAACTDCFPQKLPDTNLRATAEMNTWVFTCGQIDMK